MFSRTRGRVLALLFRQPERSFYATEIVRLAGVGTGSVQRELSRLVDAGLLNSHRVGNQVHYRAANGHPFHEAIMMMVEARAGDGVSPPPSVRVLAAALGRRAQWVYWISRDSSEGPSLVIVAPELDRSELEEHFSPAVAALGSPPRLILLRPDRFKRLLEVGDERLLSLLRSSGQVLVGDDVLRLSLGQHSPSPLLPEKT
ncbi:winged helix-turn-helix transcriptional regulator [Marinihelvus fidelis]|uniref:Winged helix-turn-helix transcriptional regulator n=2 Tax=Marinihelvus fidelis TaxID=2613842 RepID=A0A5N0T8T1_9GAMM|nr:winged helix-turn-helix transcriptional regulator [Marinihelvus fidelis]